jgi:hypothetical protein
MKRRAENEKAGGRFSVAGPKAVDLRHVPQFALVQAARACVQSINF